MTTATYRKGGTTQRISAALIIGGLLLVLAPIALVRVTDWYVTQSRAAEVERWLSGTEDQADPPSAPRDEVATIEPGAEGYLLEIPKIGVRVVVRELEPDVFSGKNTPLLKRYGLGQVPFTESLGNVSPGAEGTAAITGHRTTSGAPFRNIHRLGPGDGIIVRKGNLRQIWEVTYSTRVVPSEVEAIRSRPGIRRLAILACDPPFSARERLVVYGRLVEETQQ